MSFIYFDESGDLGFDFTKPKTSKYFVVTFLFTNDKKPIEKIIKKIFAGFTPTQVKAHHGVLHSVKESPRTRQKLLNLLAQHDISILTVYLNKKRVYTKLADEKHVLYNFVTNILLDRIMTKKLIPTDEPITLVASRRETNKFLNDNFKTYLEGQMKNNHALDLKVEIKTPSQEKCLQAVDFASWAVFRKREYDDETYYNIIKGKIIEESPLFP
jgi:dipeptidyl aminopeptidase/acylaminoacyl peptidase